MFDNIENLKILNSSSGITKPYVIVQNRKTSSFVFRTSGANRLDFKDKSLTLNEGELIFLPAGSSYESRVISEKECHYTSISFEADRLSHEPSIYPFENCPDADYICSRFPDLWNLGNQADKYKCISLFYELLSYISNIEHMKYSDKKKYSIIEPSVNYLKAHIYDSALKADNLHLLCGISSTYFRKIFTSNFSMSPQKYIVSKRISYAKSIIDSGNFATISEVALSVGYNDPLYFSRAFKKKYGVSPTNMKEVL